MPFNSPSRNQTRFDKIDVLNLLDPHWLERSQASRLVQMVADSKKETIRNKHTHTGASVKR